MASRTALSSMTRLAGACAVALLALAPLPAAAQDAGASADAAPALLDEFPDQPLRRGPCPAPPDPQWSQAERQAWEKICAGLVADMMPDLPPAPDDTPVRIRPGPEVVLSGSFLAQILSEPRFTDAITFRGVRIRHAHFVTLADLSYINIDKPLRINGSVFDQPLLLHHSQSKSDIDLSGSSFNYLPPDAATVRDYYALDLTQARIDLSLRLSRIFSGDVSLTDLTVGRHAQLDGSTIDGRVYLDGAHIGGMLWLRDTQLNYGLSGRFMDVGNDVVMYNLVAGTAKTDPATRRQDWTQLTPSVIEITNSRIHGNLSVGRGEQVDMPPELDQLAQRDQPKEQEAAQALAADPPANPQPGTSGAARQEDGPPRDPRFMDPGINVVVGTLDLAEIEVGGEIWIRNSDVRTYLTLEDARASGDLWLTDGKINDNNLSAVSVGGFLLLQDTSFPTGFYADSVEVGRDITMSPRTSVTGPFYMPGLNGHGSFYAYGAKIDGPVNLRAATIDGDLKLTDGAVFSRDIDASFSRIGQSLDLHGSHFGSVNLTGASIGSELRLTAGTRSAATSAAEFQQDAVLDLRNARADSLQDVTDVWPDNLQLVGFDYRQLGGSDTDAASPPAASANAATPAPAARRKSCRDADVSGAPGQRPGVGDAHDAGKLLCWLQGQKPFSPAPYAHLAGVLRESGEQETADAVTYGGLMRQWREMSWWRSAKYTNVFPWALIGFGVYPKRTAIWVAVLLAFGTWAFSRDPAPELQRLSWAQRSIYSLDMLLPVVHLRHHHYEIELRGWPRYYLYVHKIAGYVLLTFLAAALLGGGGLE